MPTSLDRVFLVAPSSTEARIASTVAQCRGFVYAASTMGVTGVRTAVSGAAQSLVERVRAADAELPVCVGLGVSNADQAAEVAAFADGVIVGSAFVRRLLDAPDSAGVGVRPRAGRRTRRRRPPPLTRRYGSIGRILTHDHGQMSRNVRG